ncbi:[protein-PII] uridylyltransferase [Rhodocyclus gracilis]|uniref:Bifunctional uridylyltransferase/uridylyl-removing enzyme n=1 Tax=Rhodocyclus tenuis TaxID=1066 RepID=A0A6L5JSJ5_RHOTE|nr:[protein-PII] uridylyltransferase [Rhodocyclus gracilis]MQY50417.1 [protein-PII] uridylyltransferase [Rhodocyclus gracilis]
MTATSPDSALIHSCKTTLREGQEAICARYREDHDSRRLLQRRCRLVDRVLSELWRELAFPPELTLVAVGGYGRGELYPASDIDLLLLLPSPPDMALQQSLERLIGLFWDIGLEVGHSVRTIDECLTEAAGDITVQTALIETRRICGDEALFSRFRAGLKERLDVIAFFRAKRLEQEERHQRYQETPYSLEPNCKESPGGLRDLQMILWIAQAAGYGAHWRDLKEHGFITANEERRLERCEGFLRRLRVQLHIDLGRRDDRVLFDYQSQLASHLGYEAASTRQASEALMKDYYRTAKNVTQLNAILLLNLAAALLPTPHLTPKPINARFRASGDLLDVVSESVFQETPSAILESFLLMQQHAELQGMTARTLRALWRAAADIDDDFRRDPGNHALFLQLFQQPRGLVHEFRRMNQLSVLGRYLPNFGRIVGQMQHDLFHVYTVDQHIMQVMRNLRRFTMHEFAHEYPVCSRLISDFERPWLLYVAALFHDIGKGRGGDHSELGAVDAREFCEQHQMNAADSELVVWIVRQHLVMSHVAQKQDTSDPETIARFAAIVGDERHLTALYLFTVADIRGTSPKVWNAWKGQLLEELFSATRKLLATGGEIPATQGIIEERQQEARRLLRYFALSETVHERLWKQLDTVYFLRHSADEIAWHTRALHYRTDKDQPVVKARLCAQGVGLEVMVYTTDQPDLFTRLVAFFGRAGYTILDAKIHTTRHGYALDSFVLQDLSGRGEDREMINYIEHELATRLVKQTPPEAPSGGRLSRQVKHFPFEPTVTIKPDEKGARYILFIGAADRPGLLYTVATTLAEHGAKLHTAKISTLGERIEDTFLVSGGSLGESAGRIRLETALIEQLRV